MNRNLTVLVVDAEIAVRTALCATLKDLGFASLATAKAEEAIYLARRTEVHAVLLGRCTSGKSGIQICRSIRRSFRRLPILMLSECDSEDESVEALDAGADDYITKPVRHRELRARLCAAIRRAQSPETNDDVLVSGEISLDPVPHLVQKGEETVHLTPKEFDLLHYLMAHPGRLISHERLLISVWGPEYGREIEYLRTFMRHLRKKLEDNPSLPRYLLTIPYIGYRFEDRILNESPAS